MNDKNRIIPQKGNPNNCTTDLLKKINSRQNNASKQMNYSQVYARIGNHVNTIASTQDMFSRKQNIETSLVKKSFYELLGRLNSNYDISRLSWEELFLQQINNVSSLNKDLVGLALHSDKHRHELQSQLYKLINETEKNILVNNRLSSNLTPVQEKYNNYCSDVSDLSDDSVDYYKKMRLSIEHENKALDSIEQIGLSNTVHQGNKKRIKFLDRHLSYYRNIVYSAKRMSLTTKQICDTLEDTLEAYSTISPLGKCISEIYRGIGLLEGHTKNLSDIYTTTADIINNVKLFEGDSSSYSIISEHDNRIHGANNRLTMGIASQIERERLK